MGPVSHLVSLLTAPLPSNIAQKAALCIIHHLHYLFARVLWVVSFNGGEIVNELRWGDGVGWLKALQPAKADGV